MRNVLLVIAVGWLSSCVNFYPNPGEREPAVVIVEKGDRRQLGWYEGYDVSEIDGKPVSHMGTNLGFATIRIAPGRHNILFTVGYRHGGDDPFDCPCRAYFPLVLELKEGQVLKIVGSIKPSGEVTFGLVDQNTNQPLFAEQIRQAQPVPKNMTLPVGRAFITINSTDPNRPNSSINADAAR